MAQTRTWNIWLITTSSPLRSLCSNWQARTPSITCSICSPVMMIPFRMNFSHAESAALVMTPVVSGDTITSMKGDRIRDVLLILHGEIRDRISMKPLSSSCSPFTRMEALNLELCLMIVTTASASFLMRNHLNPVRTGSLPSSFTPSISCASSCCHRSEPLEASAPLPGSSCMLLGGLTAQSSGSDHVLQVPP
eukprot:681926-Hanusia_phi.AAC.1